MIRSALGNNLTVLQILTSQTDYALIRKRYDLILYQWNWLYSAVYVLPVTGMRQRDRLISGSNMQMICGGQSPSTQSTVGTI
jgi:hypothetical protein